MKIDQHRFDPSALDRLLVTDPDTGEFLVHRDIFRDPDIFELEMKYIFERNLWAQELMCTPMFPVASRHTMTGVRPMKVL